MLDFGLVDHENLENYDTKSLDDLVPGDEITGEIVVQEIKDASQRTEKSAEFSITITDHTSHLRWICEFETHYNLKSDVIYGERGDLFYHFFDSLNHVVNRIPLSGRDNYSVNFSRFINTINKHISNITVKTVESVGETVHLEVVEAEITRETSTHTSKTIYELTQEDTAIFKSYINLRNRGDRITITNMQVDLKTSLDDGKISESDYKTALKALKTIKSTVNTQ